MRIAFLPHNAYAMGGTVRTTMTLADTLAGRHQVELVSVFRHREKPQRGRSPEVPLRALVDRRKGSADAADPLARRAGEVFPKGDRRSHQYHQLAEQRVIDWLRETDADVVVGTRAGLNALVARFGPRHAVRVGQEHLTHDNHPHRLRTELQRWYGGLDALVTMTETDARDHRRGMRLRRTRVPAIPNSVPEPLVPSADAAAKVVVAAGGLARVKRYEMLVDAFALAGAACPDWSLRIHGGGPERARTADRTAHHGLGDRVFLADRYRTRAQCSPLQGGGVGHPHSGGPEGRRSMAGSPTSDNVVVGPTAGRAGSQPCGGRVRPTPTGRQWPVKQEPKGVPRWGSPLLERSRELGGGTDRNLPPSGRRGRQERLFSTLVQERAGRSAPPPPGPADWRDRATALAATAGVLARAAVRRGRRKLGWVG
jgi:glycosyltransferase involved in cell wall biosynthesis